MSTSSWCPSCCPNCYVDEISSEPSNGLYALEKLLLVGIVFVNVEIKLQHLICDHTHAQDGWHRFKARSVIPHLSDSEDISLFVGIEYLEKYMHIKATYRATHDTMALRIYLIPLEISHADDFQGLAAKFLRQVLLRVNNNEKSWKGLEITEAPTPFLRNPEVRLPSSMQYF